MSRTVNSESLLSPIIITNFFQPLNIMVASL